MSKVVQELVAEPLRAELHSVDFYLALAEAALSTEIKELARQFAVEEERHFQTLVEWLEQDGDPTLCAALREVRLLLGTPHDKGDATGRRPERYDFAHIVHSQQVIPNATARIDAKVAAAGG